MIKQNTKKTIDDLMFEQQNQLLMQQNAEEVSIVPQSCKRTQKKQFSISKSSNKPNKNLFFQNDASIDVKPTRKKRIRLQNQQWSVSQVRKVFSLYTQYGSQWTIIESEFSQKNANSIKNRFYTVIRIMLKNLFRLHPEIGQKLPNQIPSRQILLFYENKGEFSQFKGLGKKILKIIDYDIESKKLSNIALQYKNQIGNLFRTFFSQQLPLLGKNIYIQQKNQLKKAHIFQIKAEQLQVPSQIVQDQAYQHNNEQNNVFKQSNQSGINKSSPPIFYVFPMNNSGGVSIGAYLDPNYSQPYFYHM